VINVLKFVLPIWVCFLAYAASVGVAAETWKAGTGREVITPSISMPMAGYASRGAAHAKGKLHDLWAKTIVLEDPNGTRCALVTLDLCGIDASLSERVFKRLKNSCKLEQNQIILACSHTHSGPVVAGNLRPLHYMLFNDADRKLVDDYAKFLEAKIDASVQQAVASLMPCELSHGETTETFATNRRNNPEKDVPTLRAEGKLKGPVDHSVPVMVAKRDGKPIAVVFGYACHCTTLDGMEWNGDYAGFAQVELESKNPGCQAMFWAGCGADQNPIPRRTLDFAREYGTRMARAVGGAMTGNLKPIKTVLKIQGSHVQAPFGELPSREQLEKDKIASNQYVSARAKHLLDKLDAGEQMPKSYSYPVTSWRLGDEIDWVALGGEVVVDYAIAIKSLPSAKRATWVMGYANDVMAYIPSRRVLAEGGYEGGGAMVYYGQPTVWASEIEQVIVDEVNRQLSAK
jgi:neutral ceramidase